MSFNYDPLECILCGCTLALRRPVPIRFPRCCCGYRSPGEPVSEYSELSKKRQDAEAALRQTAHRMSQQASRIKLYGDNESDAEWPVEWPIPDDVWDAIRGLQMSLQSLDEAITEARRAYRARVLSWLLAEVGGPVGGH